jgi:hypothetical protein
MYSTSWPCATDTASVATHNLRVSQQNTVQGVNVPTL